MNRAYQYGLCLLGLSWTGFGFSHELAPVEVPGAMAPLPVSASQGHVTGDELQVRPLLRAGEIMEAVPGMIATQHSGNGKANQYFFRGFNLDHGTDFRTEVNGMPVNLPSHGHGQGYTDVNFLIPEVIETVEYRKGPYYASVGDFSSAGSVDISTRRSFSRQHVKVTGGEHDYYRGLVYGGKRSGDHKLVYAVEGQTFNGPWRDINEDVEKVNVLLGHEWHQGESHYATTLMVYDNTWNSADQIANRAVRSGQISRLGSLDEDAGGESHRYSLSFQWDKPGQRGSVYAIDYGLNLWSNFTYFLDDPVNGDEFEQIDDRAVVGGDVEYDYQWLTAFAPLTLHWGLEWRHDQIRDVGLFKSADRNRLGVVRRDRVAQTSAALFGSVVYPFAEKWRATLGMRYDHYYFDVRDRAGVNVNGFDLSANGGNAHDGITSPKFSLAWLPNEKAEYYLSAGYSFHSNDARGTTIEIDPVAGTPVDQVDPLVRSRGEELGARFYPNDQWQVTLAAWQLRLASELLFVGDAGNTETNRRSLRRGAEMNVVYRPTRSWEFDVELATTRARFQGDEPGEGRFIEGAPDRVMAFGAHYRGQRWFAGYRLRHFGPRPLDSFSDQESSSTTIQNIKLGMQWPRWEVALEVLNLADVEHNDIDYFYASRLAGEPAGGVEDRHFHPILPRTWRLGVEHQF
jgi:outer membrane receptor protein involved in Fe transport